MKTVCRSCRLQIVTCHEHLPSTSTMIKSCVATAAVTFNTPWREFKVEIKNEALCALENWQNRSSDRYFQEQILWAQFLHLLISRKALKSFTTTFHDQQEPSAKNACLIAHTPPSPKSHIYWPFSYLFGVVSQSYLRYWFPGCSPYFAPDKKNLTCKSHIFLFFFFFKLTLP